MALTEIIWDIDPTIVKIGSFELRYYGLLFAGGFLLGYQVFVKIFKTEGKPEKDLDPLLLTMIISTVLGARIGHYVFYEGNHFFEDPLKFITEMLIPPYAGLASHGGGFGILLGLWLYSRRHKDQPFIWLLDRMSVAVALTGAFIRFGNLMNSEIVGKPTDVPWAFVFKQNFEFSQVPRHPSQLYESLSCLLLFVIMFAIWKKYKATLPDGLLSGLFFTWIFTLRFVYEFLKEDQVAFEQNMNLNMGQWLSIPMVLLGLFLLYRAKQNGLKQAA
ncbi:prolipoprotein diacylglyceryl transferase [Marinilongibacter aquaticus]|uniref:prolipoprotein diacylglyceryl transferase n=1 Tax=Marinilongibacter aquaticus TaxID=2975157 RepID=UPI0021BD9656|nr:prolipoprotein diacylglyceryl transferase [Marinilongibacter aquaticus]UBM57672.1 prolipoprotein diacylglyceryl transferase [Marinilongibacter aquaticus]